MVLKQFNIHRQKKRKKGRQGARKEGEEGGKRKGRRKEGRKYKSKPTFILIQISTQNGS